MKRKVSSRFTGTFDVQARTTDELLVSLTIAKEAEDEEEEEFEDDF